MTKALVVLSGGQDSTTCLFWAVQEYGVDNVSAVTFNYNQRHRVELLAATTVATLAGVNGRHEIVDIGPILKGTSPLTNQDEELERYTDYQQMEKVIGNRVEKTFVPMRNTLFLTLAANRAVVSGCVDIITGVCQADNANYPDCRQEYIWHMGDAINASLGNGIGDPFVVIKTPLMNMSKDKSSWLATQIPGAYSALAYSHTAYDGSFPPKGDDHASVLRAQGFLDAGIPDPLILRCIKSFGHPRPKTPNYRAGEWNAAMGRIREELEPTGLARWWDLR